MSEQKKNGGQKPAFEETTLADVKQLGFFASIASLGYVFWMVCGMEVIERLSFYGVRAQTTIYATRSTTEGGLGVTMATLGILLLTWNLVQSLVPIFTGGLSDRFGYKKTIFIAILLKVLGYLAMACDPYWLDSLLPLDFFRFLSIYFFLNLKYTGFFIGAVILAIGTAVFKPAIQGSVIKASSRKNSSMAWGIFYQAVNIGGWIGPLIGLYLRDSQWGWKGVFLVNAAVICLNLLLLLTYKEQETPSKESSDKPFLEEWLRELIKPQLAIYIIIFSIWWFMFPMIWDILPRYVEDWVDTRPIVATLFGEDGTQSPVIHFLLGMTDDGKTIKPEGIVNVNAGLIMLTCFLFAAISAKMRATTSMFTGTLLVIAALACLGFTNGAWLAVGAMTIFSIGEMLASPKFSEFLGNIAPPDKKAMWMGLSQMPILIGWALEGWWAPWFYNKYSSKDMLARDMLLENGMTANQITTEAIPPGEALSTLAEKTGETPEVLTQLLYENNEVGTTWLIFAGIGVLSAVLIFAYGIWIGRLAAKEKTQA